LSKHTLPKTLKEDWTGTRELLRLLKGACTFSPQPHFVVEFEYDLFDEEFQK